MVIQRRCPFSLVADSEKDRKIHTDISMLFWDQSQRSSTMTESERAVLLRLRTHPSVIIRFDGGQPKRLYFNWYDSGKLLIPVGLTARR
jgi:hypothetical protein